MVFSLHTWQGRRSIAGPYETRLFFVFFFRVFFGEQKQVSIYSQMFLGVQKSPRFLRDFPHGIFSYHPTNPKTVDAEALPIQPPNSLNTGIALEIEEPKVKKGVNGVIFLKNAVKTYAMG